MIETDAVMAKSKLYDTGASRSLPQKLDWKIWVEVDEGMSEGNFNQPVSIKFNQDDNIDDLKTKILLKLRNLRSMDCNDNHTIVLGFLCTVNTDVPLKESSEIADYVSHRGSEFDELRHSGGNSTSNDSWAIYNKRMSRSVSHDSSQTFNVPYAKYVATSMKNLDSNSPILTSPFLNGQGTSTNHTYESIQKSLNCTIEPTSKENISRLIFAPDELVKNIYIEVYGSLGSQLSSEPLIVFLNNDRKETSQELETVDYVKRQQMNEGRSMSSLEDLLQQGTEMSPSSENSSKNMNIYPGNQEFRLITDEEQFRKVSEDMGSDNKIGSPRQAILLLPKHFKKEDTSESHDKELELKQPIYDRSSPFDNANDGSFYESRDTSVNITPPELVGKGNLLQTRDFTDYSHAKASSNPEFDNNTPSQIAMPVQYKSTSDRVFPKINVLIVEDNVINQTILASFLRKHKISYKIAKNGKQAVDKWKEGGIHLIFMDLQLPVLSGIDAAKKIRDCEKLRGIGFQKTASASTSSFHENRNDEKSSIYSGTSPTLTNNSHENLSTSVAPVIIVAFTASNSINDKREALISGCNDYLTKPVNLHWLSKKITEWGCMQGLIDFDKWKQGQSRMTDSVLKQQTKLVKTASHKSLTRTPSASNSKLNKHKSIDK